MDINVSKKRFEWIDFCKFIAIFYMVWAHVGMPSLMDKYIHVFHMPIFFFLSGYLFNIKGSKNLKDFFIKKTKSLLVPYFMFSLINYYFWAIAYKSVNSPIPETQLTLFKGIFTFNTIISPFKGVQWFLTCLFLVEIMFYMIIKIIKNNEFILGFVLFLFSLAGYFYSSIINVRLYWGIDTALTALVFYGIGYLFHKTNTSKIKSFIFSPSLYKILILLIISIISTFLNQYVNLRTLQYGNYFLFYLSSITSIIMYIMLSEYICRCKKINNSKLYMYLLYIGRNTIVILVLNQLFIQLLGKLTKHITIISGDIRNIISAVIVVILMMPTAYVLNRYLPFSIGKKSIR